MRNPVRRAGRASLLRLCRHVHCRILHGTSLTALAREPRDKSQNYLPLRNLCSYKQVDFKILLVSTKRKHRTKFPAFPKKRANVSGSLTVHSVPLCPFEAFPYCLPCIFVSLKATLSPDATNPEDSRSASPQNQERQTIKTAPPSPFLSNPTSLQPAHM